MTTDLLDHAPIAAGATDSIARRRASWILSGLVVLFLLFDAVSKVLVLPPVVEATAQLGWPADSPRTLGLVLLACVVLYVVPRTAVLGAVLLTGYLGGAVATQFRIGNPLLSHVLFPTYIGIVAWVGIHLRDARVRALLPFRSDR